MSEQLRDNSVVKVSLLRPVTMLMALLSSIVIGVVALVGIPLELLPAFPDYMAGFLLALEFTPRISRLAVEFLSRAFGQLPDEVLVPWMPKLVVTLRPLGVGVMQTLVKEAGLAFPRELSALPTWEFAWERTLPAAPTPAKTTTKVPASAPAAPVVPAITRSPEEEAVAGLIRAERATTEALAAKLGVPVSWTEVAAPAAQQEVADEGAVATVAAVEAATPTADDPIARLLAAYPDTLQAIEDRVRRSA